MTEKGLRTYLYVRVRVAKGAELTPEALQFEHTTVEAADVDEAYNRGYEELGSAYGDVWNDYVVRVGD